LFSTGQSTEAKSRIELCFATGMKYSKADDSWFSPAKVGSRHQSAFLVCVKTKNQAFYA